MGCHFLLIGTAREIHPKIKRLGHRLSLICPMRNLRTLSNYGDYDCIVGMPAAASAEEWVEQARLVQQHDAVNALGGFNEVTQHLAAIVGAALGLPFHSLDVIQRTREKDEMRRVLREAGLDDTPARLVASQEDVHSFAVDHGFPIVLKPADGRGSLGVSIARSQADIPKAMAWFEQWASEHRMLAEKMLLGEEWSVEAFSERGQHRVVCVTQKFKDPQTSVETGHCLPAPIPEPTRAAIEQFVAKVLTAIGIENGPSHTEVFVTPEGPRVVETHARLAGDSVVELIQLASGVDLDELWIRQAAGESVLDEVPTSLGRWASIAFATPQAVGTLERIDGREQAQAIEGVMRVELLQEPGTEVHGAHDSFSRAAFAIAVADESQEAVRRARDAVSKLRFVVACPG
jgi:biotin carboxylase